MDIDRLHKAQQLEKDLLWDEAASLYTKMLKEDSSVSNYERASWCLSRAGKYIDALKYLLKLHEIQPNVAKWAYMIGYQYYCQKDWHKAVEWFEKSLEKFPDYFVVKYRLAYAYIKTCGEYKKLTKAEYWKALSQLKECHIIWKRLDSKKQADERNVYFDINFLHGKLLMGMPNHRDEAIMLFKDALKIKPDDEFAQYELAKVLYLNGEYESASKNLPRGNKYYIVELDAYISAKLGYHEKSVNLVSDLLKKRKKDYLYAFLAEVYLLSDLLREAYMAASNAVKLGSNNHKNYYILGKTFYKNGLLGKAIENLDTAIRIKKEKYNMPYEECEELRKIIMSEMTTSYCEDDNKLKTLNINEHTKKINGVICKYLDNKGFGFIRYGNNSVFFHISNCNYKDLAVGDSVTFDITNSPKGVKAIDINIITKKRR